MNDLTGNVNLSKRLRRHPVWLREPANYGQAWVDLLLIANDKPRSVVINGETIELKRGQLAWSIRTLEREWSRSAEWIGRFLNFCRDETMILVDSNRRRTVITILNYEAYQNTKPETEPGTDAETEPETKTGSKPEQKLETGIGRGNDRPSEIPSDEEVGAFCLNFMDLQRGIEGIPEGWWSAWLAYRLEAKKSFLNWERTLVLGHRSDWLNPASPGHGKARLNISAKAHISDFAKKPRRERGEILQELSLAAKCGAGAAQIEALKNELKEA